jgi:hypothetical protein
MRLTSVDALASQQAETAMTSLDVALVSCSDTLGSTARTPAASELAMRSLWCQSISALQQFVEATHGCAHTHSRAIEADDSEVAAREA